MYSRILLASDGSLDAGGALEPALALAKGFNAALELLVVMALPKSPLLKAEVDDAVVDAERRYAYLVSTARSRAQALQVLFGSEMKFGSFVRVTIEYAKERKPQLLVIGKGGRSKWTELLLGSDAERIAFHALCSVHIVRG